MLIRLELEVLDTKLEPSHNLQANESNFGGYVHLHPAISTWHLEPRMTHLVLGKSKHQ
jgi:hypothetical protein